MVTRVPLGFEDKLLCQRLDQSYAVGPLLVNREAVLKITTSLSNNKTIYTDNNGYQMMKREYKKYSNNILSRVRTRRTPVLLSWINSATYIFYVYLDLCLCLYVYVQNYYPMVRGAYIEDEDSRLVLLSERAHGVASLNQGQIEVHGTHTLPHELPFLFQGCFWIETLYRVYYKLDSRK